jgi:hypothetical protein
VEPSRATAAYGHCLHSFAQFGQSLSRLHGQQAIPCQSLPGGIAHAPDEEHRKNYFFEAIFFLTVINVLLYSKYATALDHYSVL